ncbi:MAG: hypothetical protein AAGG01_09865 [Planctomycetota bacterium]
MRTAFRTPTPSLESSLDFYRRAGFERIDDRGSETFAAVTDGGVVVEIDADRFTRSSVVVYAENAAELAATAGEHARVHERGDGYLTADPSGAFVWLKAAMPDHMSAVAGSEPAARLGKFAGVSIEAVDPGATLAFWERLGFALEAGGLDQGWAQLGCEGAFGVSVMGAFACPHLFFNPGLTYFNSGKNPEIIAGLREAGVPLTEEITQFSKTGDVDNVIVRDPGGTGFFVFND